MIDKERITRQFVKLVSIDAPSYREREMADYLTKELEELGFSVEEDDAWKVYGGNCGNLYAHRPGSGSPLLLGMHMDTVEPAKGKKAVVIGRSNIVGKPMAMLLLHADCTVEITHSKTVDLKEITKTADILVAAIGKAKFVTADMVKDGAVVIDVGMNRDENGKLCGDVDFDSVAPKCSYITPVPGGVGPMTISMLMQNTLTAAKLQNNL